MSPKKHKKPLADIRDETIEAITDSLFRFEKESQAVSLMQRLSKQYAISADQQPIAPGGCPTLTLWIQGFALTPQETEKGYKGNFARIAVKKIAGGKVTLVAEKLPVELKKHPQKERPKRKLPDSGHPVLRAARFKKTYADIAVARNELLKLHEEFPETSIPGNDKLNLMVYSKQSTPPVSKITLRIVALEGGFILEMEEKKKAEKPAKETPGKFAAMVKLQRKPRAVKKKKEE